MQVVFQYDLLFSYAKQALYAVYCVPDYSF